MTDRNAAIINKIKGLLSIANDQKNDEESQSAFILAQKLMMKHDISSSEVEEQSNSQSLEDGQVTVHKKLFWWERKLAQVISENFRVKFYYNNKLFDNSSQRKRAIMFLGFQNDVALAKEMYLLAYEALVFYSNRYVEDHYEENQKRSRVHRITNGVKNSYMRGFLQGLERKFEEQVKEMQQEYGLMVLVPIEVVEEYDNRFGGKKGISFKLPPVEEALAFEKGFIEGNRIDYTKSTIDEDIVM
ncbi:DUF2786 domain-containing protein [Psychrobacillus sp. FSL K6-1464]|uniref:DUF2786 domain-containing protein n=1 Tax=Psychrobacillus sp. FSL K6-1464 TaxID=2921545 RepID=UPI0030F64850